MFTIAGTGSRSLALDPVASDRVLSYLVTLLTGARKKHPELRVLSGMSEGFDELLAGASVATGVPFVAVLPNPSYLTYAWRDHSYLQRDRLKEAELLLAQASEVVTVSTTLYVGGRHSNLARNEWMADRCDVMWVYNPVTPGTRHCYGYCRRKGVRTYLIQLT
jgi:hypothetical protein